MSLSVGIVGLPNAGKSTLFNALASRRLAETAPRPFTTIKPHEAVVPMIDGYLDKLAKIIQPEKTIAATVTFIDIAGLVTGAHEGAGLGNQFLAHIREVDAICHVVRAFADPQVISQNDKYEIGTLPQIYADIAAVNIELELGQITKPQVIVLNVGEEDINSTPTHEKIMAVTQKFNTDTLAISAKIEEELIDFNKEERTAYLAELGVAESGLVRLIKHAYAMLNLITFYTIKSGRQVHAWSLKKGSTALEAAAKVHTDFATHFIKAEVINVDQFLSLGNWKQAKEAGKIRSEGKDYLVQDKDILEFKYNK